MYVARETQAQSDFIATTISYFFFHLHDRREALSLNQYYFMPIWLHLEKQQCRCSHLFKKVKKKKQFFKLSLSEK